ncbi:MAG: cytochrome c family protein [Chitinophagaceae bacterium]|nr:cytochrome c family protein [Chitinophagaceae bacterium]
MYILLIIIGIIIVAAFITIDNDLRLLKQKQFHSAIEHSRFMRLMDIIFNRFFEWRVWKKLLPALILVVILLTGVICFYIRYALPKIPPVPDIVIDHHDSALLKRGEYLTEHVAICVDCHSPRNVNYFSWPIVSGQKGAGGPFLSQKLGFSFPGESFTPNITPASLGNWSDGELYRLLTTGIDKDGKTINHVMPFQNFSKADPGDIKAIIAYIRTLPTFANKPAGITQINFFHSLYNRTIPRIAKPVYLKDLKTAVDSGRYLVTIASCNDCHTPKKWLEINDTTRMLSGGIEYPLPTGGFVHSANLTPDESGLGSWTAGTFVNKFRSYGDSGAIYKVEPNSLNSLMPWSTYRYMTDKDLQAIYTYLKSIKPVYNPVVKFTRQSLKKIKNSGSNE